MDKPTVASVTADLVAEQDALDAVVAPLDDDAWELVTPSPGWTVRDQIGHLAFFDMTAALAITDPSGFVDHREAFVAAAFASPDAADDLTLGAARAMTAGDLLSHWRHHRDALATAAATCAEDARIEWYGPSMGAKSFLTARLMEAWAHGQDICDTVGARRPPTDRLRHIAQLGVITRGWTYINRGLEIPAGDVRVALTAPSGAAWVWGPDTAEGSVTGPALDFCLVTAQRRNIADVDLDVEGEIAVDWMAKAQLFAGPASDPPAPQT
ncbi:MAG: TIGR03084 family metal-binding protein [Actinomycetota bacterium]